MSLVVRYYGILFGLYLCVLSAWILSYRIFTEIYPWQVELIDTGFLQEEVKAVRDALALAG